MKVMLSLVALVLVVAATPSEVVPIVAANGYYIEEGADATQEVVGDAVAEARFAGGALSVVVLAQEPPAGATTFADSVLSGLPSSGATVLVVAPETVGWASAGDVWSNGELDAALDASLDGRSSDDVVTIFISELLEPSTGGASGMVIFLGIVVLVGGAFAFFAIRASKRQRKSAAAQVEALRATAQLQIDAIANDILDLEDEVKLAQDPKVQEHYSAAVDTYTTASERLAAMSSGKEIVEFDYELDVAVWNLDTAEAILDGNPLPDKPERPVYTPLPAKPPARPASSEAGSRVAGTLPQYQRRSQRRSSYGASEMLATVLATQAMRGMGGRRRSGSFGSFGGSRSSGGRSRSTPRMRGGGRRR